MSSRPIRLLVSLIPVAAAVALLIHRTADAQTVPPIEVVRLFGTRHVVLVPSAAPGAEATLQLTNIGWESTSVAVLAMAATQTAACPAPLAFGQIVASACGQSIGPAALARLPVQAGADYVLVYSIDPEAADAACQALDAVTHGTRSLGEWERQNWRPGEPVAAVARGSAPQAVASVAGETAFLSFGADRARFLPQEVVIPSSAGARVVAVHTGPDCATVPLVGARDTCAAGPKDDLPFAPFSGREIAPKAGSAGIGLSPRGAELGVMAEVSDAKGWLAYGGSGAYREGSGQLFFPLAVGPIGEGQAHLWVTNRHMTATATIEIAMVDGTGSTRAYTDPDKLCPGSTRTYDITQLAGTIPGSGRMGGPYLTFRVTSLSDELPTSPPVAATLFLDTSLGVTAYAGFTSVSPINFLGARRDQPLPGTPVYVVPGVKVAAGTPPRSTGLALQSVRPGGGGQRFFMDFYDTAGRPVVLGAYIVIPGDRGAFFDLGRTFENLAGERLAVPAGFEGSVILRGEQARGALAVLAFEYPTRQAIAAAGEAGLPLAADDLDAIDQTAGDRLDSYAGVTLLRPIDPSLPTATASPTRRPPTPTPATPTPGPTGTTEPTAVNLYLPTTLRGP